MKEKEGGRGRKVRRESEEGGRGMRVRREREGE